MRKVAGRLDVNEADAYRFLSSALRERTEAIISNLIAMSGPKVEL